MRSNNWRTIANLKKETIFCMGFNYLNALGVYSPAYCYTCARQNCKSCTHKIYTKMLPPKVSVILWNEIPIPCEDSL